MRETALGIRVVSEDAMALYRVHFLDHGDNIRTVRHFEHDRDELAIEITAKMPAILFAINQPRALLIIYLG
jgi:hypothetical protein